LNGQFLFQDQHSFDNISELSDEATNSDSGHGSSDVDLTNQSNSGHGKLLHPFPLCYDLITSLPHLL